MTVNLAKVIAAAAAHVSCRIAFMLAHLARDLRALERNTLMVLSAWKRPRLLRNPQSLTRAVRP